MSNQLYFLLAVMFFKKETKDLLTGTELTQQALYTYFKILKYFN